MAGMNLDRRRVMRSNSPANIIATIILDHHAVSVATAMDLAVIARIAVLIDRNTTRTNFNGLRLSECQTADKGRRC
jgi:hypothetical protein